MPRAANRLSPLPIDGEQLVAYLNLVSESNQAGISTLEEISERGTSEILKPNGGAYKKGNISSVIRNLNRLGFFVESLGSYKVRDIVLDFLNDEFEERSVAKGHEQIPPLGHLLLECMEELGRRDLDPYISDQMSYFFDVIRKGGPDAEWSNRVMLDSTSEEKDPVHGFQYQGLTRESSSRIAQEYLKLLGIIGVISKENTSWKLSVDADAQEYVRERLSSLSFQKYLEKIIREMGAEHPLLAGEKTESRHIFFRGVGRYITYRYSGGIGAQGGLQSDVMKSINKIRVDLEKEYISKKKGANKGRDALSLISDLRGLYIIDLSNQLSGVEDLSNLESALRAMSLHELQIIAEKRYEMEYLAELLRSRGAGRYSRLTLKRLQHQEGQFILPSSLVPYRWQLDCLEKWVNGDQSTARKPFTGIASAVTGTGKTVMALMAASSFVQTHPNAIVSVVVPSKVLMYQWAEEAAKFLGIGPDEIGFVGDGFSDSFSEGRRMIIWIVNSAVKDKRLQKDLDSVDNSTPHLLIADECHEYGGDKFRLFLESRAEGRLAISATPPDQTAEGDKHPVLNTMGAIFYRLGYRQAHAEDLISGFRLRYLGIDLAPEERARYIRLSDEIRRLNRELEEMYGPQLEGSNIIARLQSIMKSGEGNATIALFLRAVRERKEIVRSASHRDTASVAILQKMIEEEDENFTMLWFHEQIDETQRLVSEGQGNSIAIKIKEAEKDEDQDKVNLLKIQQQRLKELSEWFRRKSFVRPGMYHSKFPHPWGHWMIDWFRNGYLNVMLSARALAQGFDMPGADVGNIRSSTSNVRQRIQTIGRMIRKKESGKEAQIWILFVKDTIDERIFMKHDWEEELPDVKDVQTYWELNDFGNDVTLARPERRGGVELLPQPDRVLTEEELLAIDVDGLECGDDYPDRRAIRSTAKVVRVSEEGVMTIMDGGAPFDFDYEPLQKASAWVRMNRGRGQIHVLENGHAVGRTQTGRVAFLASTNLSEFTGAVAESIEKGEDFDTFMAGFKKT